MAYRKIKETLYTKRRYYKNGRLYIKDKCELCVQEREIRYDHYNDRFLKRGKKIRCRQCASVKFGRSKNTKGYIVRHYKSYPRGYWNILSQMSKKNGQLLEHRAILAISLNRTIKTNEIVHHKNGVRDDNRTENLELCMVRQPMGQRVTDLIEENRKLRRLIKEKGLCL